MAELGVDVAAALGRRRPARTSPATRRCRSSGSRCWCCPRDGDATLVVPRLEAPRVVERPDVFALRPWERDRRPDRDRGRAGAARPRTAGGRRPHLGPVRGRPQARAARRPVRHGERRSLGPLRAVKDAAEVEALRRAAAAVDRIAAELQAGEIPLVGPHRGRGVGRPRPAHPRRGPPPRELRHRRRRARTPPAPTTRPATG